jgi:SAM-dependent methyltransferase
MNPSLAPLPSVSCPPVKDGLISTLNKMGYMMVRPEAFNQAFIDFAATAPAPVLDIGSAYGLSTVLALEQGATVVANDLDARHLEILLSKVRPQDQGRLQLMPGRMPEDLTFPNNSFSAVLASRVLNFIHPVELPQTFRLIYQWLQKGGKFFFLGGSPYAGTYTSFLLQYQHNKQIGVFWPGYITMKSRY